MVLTTSVASKTSTDMITSLAPMTSTAYLAQKLLALYILSDFSGIRDLSSINDLNNLSGLNHFNSLFLSKKNLENLMFSSTLAPK